MINFYPTPVDTARLRAIASSIRTYADALESYAVSKTRYESQELKDIFSAIGIEAQYGLQFLEQSEEREEAKEKERLANLIDD